MTHNTVEGGSNFVRHVGQKGRFELIGFFGLAFRVEKSLFESFRIGNIRKGSVHLVRFGFSRTKPRNGINLDPVTFGILRMVDSHNGIDHGLARFQGLHGGMFVSRKIAAVLSDRFPPRIDRRSSHHLIHRQSQNSFRRRIGRNDSSGGFLVHNPLHHAFKEIAVSLFAFLEDPGLSGKMIGRFQKQDRKLVGLGLVDDPGIPILEGFRKLRKLVGSSPQSHRPKEFDPAGGVVLNARQDLGQPFSRHVGHSHESFKGRIDL